MKSPKAKANSEASKEDAAAFVIDREVAEADR